MQLTTYVSGEITATVRGPRGMRRYRGPNLVTDVGLNGLVSLNTAPNLGAIGGVSSIAVGTGNTPPAPQDTYLANYSRHTRSVTSSSSAPSLVVREGWVVQRFRETCTFDPDGTARNYAEVAMFANSDPTSTGSRRMAQRALFRDELGDPTIVTVGADEYLTIEWDTYLWRSVEDQVFNVDVDGVLTEVTIRPINSTYQLGRTYSWTLDNTVEVSSRFRARPAGAVLSAHTSVPATGGDVPIPNTRTTTALGVGHVQVDCTVAPTAANVAGGIGIITLGEHTAGSASLLWRSQIRFDPPIPKDVTKEMVLSFTFKAEAGEPPED